MEEATKLGLRIRALRVRAGLTQEQLGERCRLHRTFIGRVERGETNLTLRSLGKLAHGLGVERSVLLGRNDAGT